MAKAKISVNASELDALPIAAELTNCEPGQAVKVGPIFRVSVGFRDPNSLFALGKMIGQIAPEDAKAFKEMKAKEKAEADQKAAKAAETKGKK